MPTIQQRTNLQRSLGTTESRARAQRAKLDVQADARMSQSKKAGKQAMDEKQKLEKQKGDPNAITIADIIDEYLRDHE
jgi:hypothetical protein